MVGRDAETEEKASEDEKCVGSRSPCPLLLNCAVFFYSIVLVVDERLLLMRCLPVMVALLNLLICRPLQPHPTKARNDLRPSRDDKVDSGEPHVWAHPPIPFISE